MQVRKNVCNLGVLISSCYSGSIENYDDFAVIPTPAQTCIMQDLNTEPQWKIWEKFTFRFLFLFLGFFLLNYELVSLFLTFYLFDEVSIIYKPFEKPLHWLDQ